MCAAWAWLMGKRSAPVGNPEGARTQVCTAIVGGAEPHGSGDVSRSSR